MRLRDGFGGSAGDGDDAGDDGTADNEFETDEDTLSAGDLAGDLTTDSGGSDSTSSWSSTDSSNSNSGIIVEDTSDPDATSPAGGQGLTGATADFTGTPREQLDGATEEQLRDVASQASDAYTAESRATGDPLSFLDDTTSGQLMNRTTEAVNTLAAGNLSALGEEDVLILMALGLGGAGLYKWGSD